MIDKNYFKEIIVAAEKKASEDWEIDFNLEINSIKRKAIGDEHLKDLMSNYLADSINQYNAINNCYKASFEGYLDSVDLFKETEYSEVDRINFIARMLLGFYEESLNSSEINIESDLARYDLLQQLNNLDSIVYETYSLNLKNILFRKFIKKNLKNSNTTKKDPVNNFGFNLDDEIKLKSIFDKLKSNREILAFQITYKEFKNVILNDWDSNQNTIQFVCDSTIVSVLLDRLKPLFNKFTWGNIEASKKFKLKKGNYATASLKQSMSQLTPSRLKKINAIIDSIMKED